MTAAVTDRYALLAECLLMLVTLVQMLYMDTVRLRARELRSWSCSAEA